LIPFTPSHRGGAGEPLVCIHGFMDTWRTWQRDPAANQSELSSAAPAIALHFTVVKPSQYSDTLNGPLQPG
jgi:pimeloyl-ACP methyl ester carboxylesterase